MKTLKLLIFGILISIIVCCNQKGKTKNQSELDKSLETKEIINNIPENVDSEFEIFLEFFNKDSIFQISRVNFPIKFEEINDDDYETIEKTITIENYKIIDLTINPSSETQEFDKYTQKTILKESRAKIEIRGIDNGIYCDFEFEKINGKWKLTFMSNFST